MRILAKREQAPALHGGRELSMIKLLSLILAIAFWPLPAWCQKTDLAAKLGYPQTGAHDGGWRKDSPPEIFARCGDWNGAHWCYNMEGASTRRLVISFILAC